VLATEISAASTLHVSSPMARSFDGLEKLESEHEELVIEPGELVIEND